MKSSRTVLLASSLLVFSLGAALPSHAQMRMATRPAGAISMRAARPIYASRARVAPMARPRTTAVRDQHPAAAPFIPPANNNFSFGNGLNFGNGFYGSGETIQQLLDPVPPPGFDYAYLASIDQDLALKAFIDPQTEERLALAERLAGTTSAYGGAGYYLLDGGGGYIVPTQTASNEQPQETQGPEVIVLQAAAQKAPQESAEAEPPQPVPDVGNFTLVLKNGKKITAMAFTQSDGQIVYITPDGDRHSIAASDVNDAATQQLNQDSGKELRF